MTHIHSVSGGAGSWLAAKVDMQNHPEAEHRFVFTDTLYEDADAYRLLIEGTANLLGRSLNWQVRAEDFPDYRAAPDTPIEEYRGNPAWRSYLAELREKTAIAIPELTWIVEGRDPWEVYRDRRFLGNDRIDPCSEMLKRKPFARWRDENCDPAADVIIVGIGFDERHRFDDGEGGGIGPRMAAKGWVYSAPLIGSREGDIGPFLYLAKAGIERPRLYRLDYMHNNCGGMCCKAGLAHWSNRLRVQPERFAYDKLMEQKLRAYLGANVSMLVSRRGGERKVYTLADLEAEILDQPQLSFDYAPGESGCACMLDDAE